MPHRHKQIALTDRSTIGEARRFAMAAAESLGLSEEQRSDIGIVATEAATNVILHAGSGEVLVCASDEATGAWLDLLTLDSGPGIRDLAQASIDGFSSSGTAGQGLGAISRQSDESGVFSMSGRGTVSWSRFYHHGRDRGAASYGAVSIPLRGESLCGDSYLVVPGASRTLYMVVDGLGHGPQAAEAAEEAVGITREYARESAQEIILRAHDALKKTRGAAMSVAIADYERGVLTYAGIGNISAVLSGGTQARSLVSQNGTLGVVLPRNVQEYQYPFQPGSVLVMFSDGLSSKTTLTGYAGLQNRHSQLIAGMLFRDFTRKRDDATVLVARLESGRS